MILTIWIWPCHVNKRKSHPFTYCWVLKNLDLNYLEQSGTRPLSQNILGKFNISCFLHKPIKCFKNYIKINKNKIHFTFYPGVLLLYPIMIFSLFFKSKIVLIVYNLNFSTITMEDIMKVCHHFHKIEIKCVLLFLRDLVFIHYFTAAVPLVVM